MDIKILLKENTLYYKSSLKVSLPEDFIFENVKYTIRESHEDSLISLKDISFSNIFEERVTLYFLSFFFIIFKEDHVRSLMNEITVFPGSFFPWHEGHSACVKLIPKGKIYICPDMNPWKSERNISSPFKIFQDVLKNCPEKGIVYPGFLALNKPNPTADWFFNLNSCKKNLIVGDDSFLSMDKWKDSKKLIESISILFVVARNGDSSSLKVQKNNFLRVNENLEVTFVEGNKYKDLSSTSIRETSQKIN